jgi:hypothetical protein
MQKPALKPDSGTVAPRLLLASGQSTTLWTGSDRQVIEIGKHYGIATTVAGTLSKSFRNPQFPVTP